MNEKAPTTEKVKSVDGIDINHPDIRDVLTRAKVALLEKDYKIMVEIAKENLRIKAEMHRLQDEIDIDHLTKSMTRAGMERGILKTLDKNRNKHLESGNKYRYACVAIDLDKFKSINTAFAHEGGDLALKTFAKILRRSLRGDSQMELEKHQDVMDGRQGGDEFRALIPIDLGIGSDEAEINRITNLAIDKVRFRLESALKAIKFLVRDDHVMVEKLEGELKDGELALGASFSHVCYEFDEGVDNNENLERIMQAFERADKELEPIKKKKREEEAEELARLQKAAGSINI